MYTKKQYNNNECTHRQFYSQFVNDDVKNKVLREIGLDRLLSSKDEHLNDIPLYEWDKLSGIIFDWNGKRVGTITTIKPIDYELIKATGETGGISPAVLVCIYKESARQIIEKNI